MSEAATLSDELRANYDAALNESEGSETNSSVAEVEAPQPEVKQEVTKEPTAKTRDEGGRFKKNEAQPVINDEAQPATEAQPTEENQQPVEAVKPPSTFTIEEKAAFMEASPTVQKAILRREADFQNGINQYKRGHEQFQEIEKAMMPYMATIQSLNATPAVAVQQLLSADHQLRHGTPQQKVAFFNHLANVYGIDIGQVATEQPQVDPHVRALQQELQQLRQTFSQQQTQATSAEQQYIASEIAKFESDPSHIYFNDVRKHMSTLLESGEAKDLKDAYDQACWAHPQIRQQMLKQQMESSEKKRLEELAQKAENAKRASFDVQGAGTTNAVNSKAMTQREELMALYSSYS